MPGAMRCSLVGIAGEDDLDAPDLLSPAAASGNKKERLKGVQGQSVQQSSHGHRATANSTSLKPKLDSEASAALREQLANELKDLNSAEEAANWAHRVMRAKNSLTAADAEHVERYFQDRLMSFTTDAIGSIHKIEEPLHRLDQ